ncbi:MULTISPECIES: mandelate racemase/muconate lactonizing enzyme family protein [Roseobacteraceae]|uniref:3,6-anhydro-alpha-L-galactonate cycloisomerase n=1 Tax=Pseudosulfitobacter pseudonitzschiae TaxID=1402135 RepID=A0A221K7M3_9RHOB|nr:MULTISPECIES: enolase C-terminal domain-like protein [Roseobacteraceae]ASM75012.1 3,6-anhydro-alpha-L-galactonate cycloisomerase [Pseudosulfitobacter pseudonitzschiae]
MSIFDKDLHSGLSVERIEIHVATVDLGGRVWNPMIKWTEKSNVFITLHASDGTVGIGECWCLDTRPDTLLAYLKTEVLPLMRATPLADLPALFASMRNRATLTTRHGLLESALSGLDLALWDIAAKRAGLPLWKTLNSNGTGKAPVYISGGIYGLNKTVDDLVKEMVGLEAQGFSCLKMKIGGQTEQLDTERVNAVLAALKSDTKLIIDSVYSYDFDSALRMYRTFDPARIEAFQSPLPPDDIPGMRRLVELGVPVMGIEAEYRPQIHSAMIRERSLRFLQVAPSAVGGPSRMKALVEELEGTGIGMSLEVSSSVVATLAAAHFAAAEGRVAHFEYHSIHQVLFEKIAAGGHRIEGSIMHLSDLPGLGMALAPGDAVTAFVQ